MSISLAIQAPQQTAAVEPKPREKSKPVKPEPAPQPAPPDVPAEAPVEAEEQSLPADSAPSQPENVSPGLPDIEPDYQAAHLNNPHPEYPMAARRMGWHGKVMLEVEILENGLPGEIKLSQGSGRDVLDNAAMQAVRGWKFVPARKNGVVVTKRIIVPINFNLKEAE